MIIINIIIFSYISIFIISAALIDDQFHEIQAARCYSRCLQIFVRYKSVLSLKKSGQENFTRNSPNDRVIHQEISFVDEMANQLLISKSVMVACMNDTENSCSKQCIQSCSMVGECICQQNDVGCMMACHYRKELSKDLTQEDCPSFSAAEESALKTPVSQCPKSCKSKYDCNFNQICCATESCGLICIQNENKKINLPKYKPDSTQANTSANIEFDWSSTFKPFLNKEFPLVFILQTRSCLCYKFNEKYSTPWQTLIRTPRLGVKLNALDKGTIYQFRLAAVTMYGTNGFGPISQDLPTMISKPPLPLPPENVVDCKWQIADDNKFRVEIKWKKSPDSFWRIYEFLVSWMIDHGVAQPDGEPLSSLTQYSKTLLGTEESCTIDELKPSTNYKVQIIVRAYWPGFGNILSVPTTMYITTPATKDSIDILPQIQGNVPPKQCSCPDNSQNTKDPRIRQLNTSTRNLQALIEMQKTLDYWVESYPEVCINLKNENFSKSLHRFKKLYKQTTQILLTNLRFNCRYSVEVTLMSPNLPNVTYHICFCTPPCNNNNPYQSKYCQKEDLTLPSPKEPRSSLIDVDTMTYKISWKPSYIISTKKRNLDITKYRISWAPRKYEPVRIEHYLGSGGFNPIVDFDQSDVRIVHSNITRLMLRNLTRNQLYVVKIQSLGITVDGEIIESFPTTILLPTYGYSEEFYTKSSQTMSPIYSPIISLCLLYRQLMAS